LKKSRWLLLRNPSDLTRSQQARLAQILPRYRTVGRAYNLRLELQETLDAEPEAAITALRRWFFRATHSRIDPVPVIDVAYMIKRH
jgi:transposase